MQLTPRYGSDPLIVLEGSPAAIGEAVIRQRRRLASTVATFDDEQWAHPSRCAGWTNRDVIVHLDSTNTFWSFSITAGLRGEPTRFLAGFDPVASPAALVAGAPDATDAEVCDRFQSSTDALIELLGSLSDAQWSTVAEAPPGHLSVAAVAHHALWDSWIHERDVLVPLGSVPERHADEIDASLRYVAALAPAFALTRGTAPDGRLTIDVTDPDVSIDVDVTDRVTVRDASGTPGVRLHGDAVELLESLSIRRPLDQELPDSARWLVDGLAVTFDQ